MSMYSSAMGMLGDRCGIGRVIGGCEKAFVSEEEVSLSLVSTFTIDIVPIASPFALIIPCTARYCLFMKITSARYCVAHIKSAVRNS